MHRSDRGFTLVEMVGVVLILGLIMAFAVPSLRRMQQSQNIVGARDNIVAQLQMARTRAISTGIDQPVHFFTGTYGFDYHIHVPGTPIASIKGWNLPRGVTYQWPVSSPMQVTMKKDGSASSSFIIPLANTRGTRDTVAVLSSGLVLRR